MFRLVITIFCISWALQISAQQKKRCSSDEKMNLHEKLHPFHLQNIEKGLQNHHYNLRSADTNTLYVPVHVIVVHDPGDEIGDGTNHSYLKIQSQIDAVNLDFSRTNADASNTPAVFSTGNPNIVFCLASVDPDGNVTDGITRYESTANFDDEEADIKAETGWPRSQYLNIWVAEIEDLGFAYIPSTSSLPNATLDGVVIDHETFGGPGTGSLPPYNLGRTCTHEIGHYLGLRHIWRNDGCNLDDGFTDTPLQDVENYGCPTHPTPSCTNNGDMFMNYMDYTDDACMNAFTQQQSDFMRSILTGIRQSVTNSGLILCTNTPLLAILEEKLNIDCFGNSTGTIKIKAQGGSPGYTYTLNNTSNQTGLFTGLGKGQYTIVVEDGVDSTYMIEVEISEPLPMTITETIKDNVCFGEKKGSVRMNAVGGTVENSYQYSKDGINYSFNPNITLLENGNYTVFAKDDNGCVASKNIVINSPEQITASVSKSDVLCFGGNDGNISLQVSGGIPAYTYELNGVSGNAPMFTDLIAGSYTIVVTDFNKCKLDTMLVLTQPTEIKSEFEIMDVLCHNEETGEIVFAAEGGFAPYTYSIDGVNYFPGNVFDRLRANDYIGHIKDSRGCIKSFDQLLVQQPDSLTILNVNYTLENSDTYQVEIAAIGGVRPYLYYVDESSTIQSDSVFHGIEIGDHIIWVIDKNGCSNNHLIAITDVEEFSLEDEFSVYPNPVIDNLAIKYVGNKKLEVNMEIFDISGKLIWREEKIKFSQEKNIHNILVNNVANSILLIKIASKFKSSHILIFKE